MKPSIVFVAAKRTPFGAFGGSLKTWSATDLAVHAAKAVLEQSKLSVDKIDHVIFGNVLQTSADAIYLARHVGLRIGLPISTPAVTVNRLCGSGFEALADAARRIATGEAEIVLAGGTESMSQSPYVIRNARFGQRMGNTQIEDSLMAGLVDSYTKSPMAITAENLAEKFKISRTECDAFALLSQQRAQQATQQNLFSDEIAPIDLDEKGKIRRIERDEHIRPDASIEALTKLKPVFKSDGVVTAGNASGMVDGACALILATEEKAKSLGLPILGYWLGSHVVGCDPSLMGIGPVPASRALLSRLNMTMDQMDLVEINEAFAPQFLAVKKELSLNPENTNIDGGAIAIGHPLGASGARLVTHLLYALRRHSKSRGLASACIGGGQGMSVVVKVG